MAPADDERFFDAMHAFGPPSDPLADPQLDDHDAVRALRTARRELAAGAPDAASASADHAYRVGVPAELVPIAAALRASAWARMGRTEEAALLLTDTWRAHPDVAALPALLGSVHLIAGDATSAAYSMHAALVSDDPDRSLALLRPLLMQLFAHAQRVR